MKNFLILLMLLLVGCSKVDKVKSDKLELASNTSIKLSKKGNKSIVLAGGCFWGTQRYIEQLPGVVSTYTAYANGDFVDVNYKQVSYEGTNHAEALFVEYDPSIIDLKHLLKYYYKTIDPYSVNRQGGDIGSQYRTGIYYIDPNDLAIINSSLITLASKSNRKIAIEVDKLRNLTKAEEYHQEYLVKNPHGYCHVSFDSLPGKDEILVDKINNYKIPNKEELKESLSDISYEVTQNAHTERPFSSDLDSNFEDGIYVDILTGQPLFSSLDKFDAGCGWPSFTKPIEDELITNVEDNSYNMKRVEVRTSLSDSHLGHVFDDGPNGSHRYCINGAALKFIKKEDMKDLGYGYLLHLFK